MAVFDLGAEDAACAGGAVTVASQVQLWALPIAEGGQEGNVDKLVVSSVACVGKGAFAAVLAPIDRDTGGRGPRNEGGNEQEREQ